MSACPMKKTQGTVGSSHFTFSLDGTEVVVTETLAGVTDGVNTEPFKVKLTFLQTPQNSQYPDGNCDHSAIGDAKLLTSQATAVEPANKLPTIWGSLKARY